MRLILLSIILSVSFFVSGQSFLPSDLARLKLWLSADSANVVSGKVNVWYDLSGNANHCTQADPNLQPDFINSSTINNMPVLKFGKNGNSADFTTLSFTDINITSNNLTLFVLYKRLGTVSAVDYALSSVGKGMSVGGTALPNTLIYDGASIIEEGISPANHSLITFNNNKAFRNGNLSPTTGAIGAMSFNTVGARADALNLFFFGEIAEIILFDTLLPNIQRSQVEKYLFDKYAPPIVLPSDITINNSVCDTTILPVNPNNNTYSYQWSTGATTSTISVNKSGKYWVRATNIFGQVSSDTIMVNYPNYTFKDSLFCLGNTITWNTNLPKNQFTFLWNDASTDSLITINQSGQYHVRIADGFGCFVESDTITATVDNFSNTASFGPDTNLCAGNPIYLKAGNQPGLSYIWNDSSQNDSLYVVTSGQYSAIITNTNNCVAKDTINITIIGQAPVAAFINSAACKNNIISFTDNSTPPSGNIINSWFWNFGDNSTLADTSITQNPFYTFSDTGDYQIQLSVTTNAGCKQTFIKNIHVAPKPIANFNNIIACQNDSALFTNLSTSSSAYMPLSYSWNFGDPASGASNTSSLTNPEHLFSQQVNYVVKLITTNNAGCKDSLTKNILVKAEVTADFTYTSPCTKIPILFQDNSTVPAPDNLNTRVWTVGTSTISGLSMTRSFSSSGLYTVTLTVTGYNSCISTITKTIDVKLPPVADFSLTSICHKDTATAIDLSAAQNGTLTSWTWSLDNVPFSSTQNATLSPIATTNYVVKLAVTNNYTCKDSITKAFTVFPLPAVDFTTSSPYYYPNTPITFYPTNTGGISYDWNINNTAYALFSPTVSFASTGTYTAYLSMKNTFGCTNTKTKTLSVVNYFFDLAVLAVRSYKSNDDYVTVEADIGNVGSARVSNFEIFYQIADAAKVREEWFGNLNPGGFLTYTFNSNALQKNTTETFITCVNLGLVNGNNDSDLNNNFLCSPSNLDEITVYDPYPNPSDEYTTFSVILPADMEVTLDLTDELGQSVLLEQKVSGKQGLNLITIPMSNYSKATYIAKITIGDKVFVKKVLKAKR